MQAIRMNTSHSDPSQIKLAYLERGGSISVIPFQKEPRVVDVSVEEGVQTLRSELNN